MGLNENGNLGELGPALGSIFVSAHLPQLIWYCCMDLADVRAKTNARQPRIGER